MEKVKVSKDVAEAIEDAKLKCYVPSIHSSVEEYIIFEHALNENGWSYELEPLNDLPLDTLIRALYIGYEVEKTSEDKLLKSYNCSVVSFKKGIKFACDTLGIEIEGINK